MAVSVNRLMIAKPHCDVCPLFLEQTVPVVRTARGYVVFCEVCALGRPVSVHPREGSVLEISVDDAGDEDGFETEEE